MTYWKFIAIALSVLTGWLVNRGPQMAARTFGPATAGVLLLSVPAVPEGKDYRAPSEVVERIRHKAENIMRRFLQGVARSLRRDKLKVRTLVKGSMPARTVVEVSEKKKMDMIMITSRGRGRLDLVLMGSIAEEIARETNKPVFMMPVRDRKD